MVAKTKAALLTACRCTSKPATKLTKCMHQEKPHGFLGEFPLQLLQLVDYTRRTCFRQASTFEKKSDAVEAVSSSHTPSCLPSNGRCLVPARTYTILDSLKALGAQILSGLVRLRRCVHESHMTQNSTCRTIERSLICLDRP